MAGSGKSRKGRRALAPEERDLWNKVARSAKPISAEDKNRHRDLLWDFEPPREPEELNLQPPATKPVAVPDEMVRLLRPTGKPGKHRRISVDLADHEVRPVGRPQAGLDRRTANRLRKGEREPDARIDLHGMTAERAHRACLRFLSNALGRGARVVLVITGKGGRRRDDGDIMASPRGVLRDSLPRWLKSSPLGHSIVGIYEASPRHGGSGAFYIYLKRRR